MRIVEQLWHDLKRKVIIVDAKRQGGSHRSQEKCVDERFLIVTFPIKSLLKRNDLKKKSKKKLFLKKTIPI